MVLLRGGPLTQIGSCVPPKRGLINAKIKKTNSPYLNGGRFKGISYIRLRTAAGLAPAYPSVTCVNVSLFVGVLIDVM